MKKIPMLFAMLSFCCLPLPTSAQNDTVQGKIRIYPPVIDPIDIVLQLYPVDSNDSVEEIFVDRRTPYRFHGLAPQNQDVFIRVTVNVPEGYVSSKSQYRKSANCPFNKDIFLRRAEDLYIEHKHLGSRITAPSDAIDALKTAGNYATTVNQQLEVTRGIGSIYANQGAYDKQQEVLASFYEEPNALDLSQRKKQVYWAERLDSILHSINYSRLHMPEQDFGGIFLEASHKDLLQVWEKFIEDFKTAYPNVPLDASMVTSQEINKQLHTVKKTLRPK